MKVAPLLIFFLSFPFWALAQIKGQIFDAGKKIPLSQVVIHAGHAQTQTDSIGAFTLLLPTKANTSLQLHFSHPFYRDTTMLVKRDAVLVIYLTPDFGSLKEVEIVAGSGSSGAGTEATVLSRQQLENLARPLGEDDLMKALQAAPGVLQTGEMQSGLYVRGGQNSQTALLLQGIPVFNAAHLLGLNSSLDPDAYDTVKLTTGGFSAQEGGWLSAYVQAEPRASGQGANQLKLGVGILTSDIAYQQLLPRYKTRVLAKARSSYYQLLSKAYQHFQQGKDQGNTLPDYAFSDFNLQAFTQLPKGSLSLMGFASQDHYDGTTDRFSLASRWGNRLLSARWKQLLGPAWLEVTQGVSRYAFSMTHQRQETNVIDQTISGYFSNLLVGLPLGNQGFIETGAFLQRTQSLVYSSRQVADNQALHAEATGEKLNLGGLFTQTQFTRHHFTYSAGVRLYRFHAGFLPAPRLKIQLAPGPWASSLYYDRTYQFHHQVNVLGINMPFDFFRFASGQLPVQQSDQLGLSFRQSGRQHTLSAGIYHRWLDGQLYYANGSALFHHLNQAFPAHTGRSYGLELEFKAKWGQVSFNTGYNLAFSKLAVGDAGQPKRWVYPVQDVRHQFQADLTYAFHKHWSLSGHWFLQTGSPFTFPVGIIPVQGMTPGANAKLIPGFQDFNNVRTPLKHRLDLGLTYSRSHKKSRSEWNLGLYNVYNRANPYFLYFEVVRQEDGTGKIMARQRSLLPLTPTIRYSWTLDL